MFLAACMQETVLVAGVGTLGKGRAGPVATGPAPPGGPLPLAESMMVAAAGGGRAAAKAVGGRAGVGGGATAAIRVARQSSGGHRRQHRCLEGLRRAASVWNAPESIPRRC